MSRPHRTKSNELEGLCGKEVLRKRRGFAELICHLSGLPTSLLAFELAAKVDKIREQTANKFFKKIWQSTPVSLISGKCGKKLPVSHFFLTVMQFKVYRGLSLSFAPGFIFFYHCCITLSFFNCCMLDFTSFEVWSWNSWITLLWFIILCICCTHLQIYVYNKYNCVQQTVDNCFWHLAVTQMWVTHSTSVRT